jgi:hypothetical protein
MSPGVGAHTAIVGPVDGAPHDRGAWQVYGVFLLAIAAFLGLTLLPRSLVSWGFVADALLWLSAGLLMWTNRGGVSEAWARTVIRSRHWEERVTVEELRHWQDLPVLLWGTGVLLIGVWTIVAGFN